jgi:threonine synthase
MSIWRWADWIAPVPVAARLTLGEGNTPLVGSRVIGPERGIRNLYLKLESCNPSGSYKDRFAAAAVSSMLAGRQTRCIATSSGNTGSALAAYCAAAGIACEIAIVETAPPSKLKQMLAHGAKLARIRGFGIDASTTARVMTLLQQRAAQGMGAIQISAYKYSPLGMSGVQTISYELNQQSSKPISHVFCPAGGGGLTLAVARGFATLMERELLKFTPRIECVQPQGNDTIAGPLRNGARAARSVRCTSNVSGLQVANVIDGDEVINACRASSGTGHSVSDDEVWQTQAQLALKEGIFCEPAGAVALAGALKAAAAGELAPDAMVVCLVTGTGFKDEASLDRMIADKTCPMVDEKEFEAGLSTGRAALNI